MTTINKETSSNENVTIAGRGDFLRMQVGASNQYDSVTQDSQILPTKIQYRYEDNDGSPYVYHSKQGDEPSSQFLQPFRL